MPENNTTSVIAPVSHKKKVNPFRFFRSFGHDARKDWLFLLCFSTCVLIVFLVFAIWTYGRVQAEKVFTFESESVSVLPITVNVDALKQTIEIFEQKKTKFNTIRQIGVDAFDPSL
jgi:hypothetical protein